MRNAWRWRWRSAVSTGSVKSSNSKTLLHKRDPAVAKAYGTSVHLRRIAAELVERNPDDDFSEYLIASLFHALNTLRFYSLSNSSASTLCSVPA